MNNFMEPNTDEAQVEYTEINKEYLIKNLDSPDYLDVEPITQNSRAWRLVTCKAEKNKVKCIEDFILHMLKKMQDYTFTTDKYGKSFIENNSFNNLSKDEVLEYVQKVNSLMGITSISESESELQDFISGYALLIEQNLEYCSFFETKSSYTGYYCYNIA